jgi:hypothetical protein
MRNNKAESHYTLHGNTIAWIEKLLDTPIDDYRKMLFLLSWRLILSTSKNYLMMQRWILSIVGSKFAKSRQLDQNFDYTVRYALKYSAKNAHKPIKYDTLKLKNSALYDLLSA